MKSSASLRRGIGLFGVMMLTLSACLKPPTIVEPEVDPTALRSRILAADGTELATLFIENRDPVKLSEVAEHLKQAVVIAEDQRFWEHKGVDGRSIARAALANAAAERTVQGGSTITQQYVKNAFFPLDRPRTMAQKVKEAELAWKIEKENSKEEILEKYLNTVYLGDGAYGVKAASENLFAKAVSDLSLAESALVAAMIRSPENYDPRTFPDKAKNRRDHILNRMQAAGTISTEDADAAKALPIAVRPPRRFTTTEPHFVDAVKRFVLSNPEFGEDEAQRAAALFRGGLDIKTSLDPKLQASARGAINKILDRPGDPEAALVAIEPRTGKIVAMVGGRDYSKSQVDLTLGRGGGGTGRQPGSAFKPFVLTTALEDGLRLDSRMSSTPPLVKIKGEKPWRPNNSEGRGGGMVPLSEAMVDSVNAVFVRLAMEVGPARVAGTAKRMGIVSPMRPVPSIALGTLEVSPLEMASAYATLANYGINVSPSPILDVVGPNGDSFDPKPKITRATDPGIAYLVTTVLQQVVERGTGTKAQIGRPAAGKTGTTDDYVDAWFVGYTPELVTAVWVGYPEGRVPMTNVHGIRVYGGTFPAMIWQRFMSQALADRPISQFALPASDMITIDIDPATGWLWNEFCSGRQTVQVLRQLAPTAGCPSPPPSSATQTATATVTSTATDPSPSPSSGPPAPSQEPSSVPSPSPS